MAHVIDSLGCIKGVGDGPVYIVDAAGKIKGGGGQDRDGTKYWEYNGLGGVAQTVISHGAGDVTEILCVQSVVAEVSGTGIEGQMCWLAPSDSSVVYDDGTDKVTLSVAADGSVTIQRTAGADTFKVLLWLMWI